MVAVHAEQAGAQICPPGHLNGGYVMRRLSAASSILAVSLLAIGGLASATLAQDASPMPTAASPAVGAWQLTLDGDAPGNAFTSHSLPSFGKGLRGQSVGFNAVAN